MAIDIVTRARRRREQLFAEITRIDVFLAMAAELAAAEDDSASTEQPSGRRHKAAKRGAGAETVAVALEIVRHEGPQATRKLLPMITARGIEIGGKSPIATLSARLSSSGKEVLVMREGRWHEIKTSGSEAASGEEESTDLPGKVESADSTFNQTKEDRYAAALA